MICIAIGIVRIEVKPEIRERLKELKQYPRMSYSEVLSGLIDDVLRYREQLKLTE